ncbi:cache domain-containing protein [uncultured Clostridium sp.]|uniref:cache domain-containing protein n=1 Tax=uncultured Clostridium sp. TaxID=59620 RepID=UPI0025D75981|nr:cache domain-containing protein [uncultured Clostridium sp.]
MSKTKSIKLDIIIKITCISILIFGIAFAGTFIVINKSFNETKYQSMERIINDQSIIIEERMNNIVKISKTIAADETVSDMSLSAEDKNERFLKYINELGLRSIGHVDSEGNLVSTDGFSNDVSEKEYFKNAMKGTEFYISNPSFIKGTDEQIIYTMVPIKNGSEVKGAITCTFDSSFLSE